VDNRPLARTEGVVTERVDDEVVVYDQVRQTAHCLSADAASVWERCDGELSPAAIAEELGLEPTVVARALDELDGAGLLDDEGLVSPGVSRREAAVRLARVGGAAFAAPLIYSVAIGPAMAAASACIANGSACTGAVACCFTSSTCTGGVCCCPNGSAQNCCLTAADCCTGKTCSAVGATPGKCTG
jgi:hypothetical protein